MRLTAIEMLPIAGDSEVPSRWGTSVRPCQRSYTDSPPWCSRRENRKKTSSY